MAKELSKKTIVEPSDFFKNELEFSDWLNNNLDEIGELLDLSLEKGEREADVGPFAADIVAKNDSGGIDENVVIENQLTKTDHSHLGKLLTYSTRYDAKKIIWIAPDFYPEHVDAIIWLNQNSTNDISYFGIKLELIRIGDSPVAHNFSLVAQPADWTREERATEGLRPIDKARMKLFERYLEEYEKIQGRKPSRRAKPRHWYGWGHVGDNFDLYCQHYKSDQYLSVMVRIRRKGTEDYDKRFYIELEKFKDDLENDIGEKLEWTLPSSSAKTTRYYVSTSHDVSDLETISESDLLKAASWMAITTKKFEDVFTKYEKKITVN